MSADFEELRLQGRTIVKRYSQFLLGLRYIFFALSLIANLVYMIRYFKIR